MPIPLLVNGERTMTHSPRRCRTPRGAVLIIVLVLLALLALLGVSLATTSMLDRQVSINYLDRVRARLAAKSGAERAIAEIHSAIARGMVDDKAMQYWGSKADEKGEPDLDTPLEKAVSPSYALENEGAQNPDDANVTPMTFHVDGDSIGISGVMGTGTYGNNSDVFRLMVADANSRIHVNDGIDQGNNGNVSQNLVRILNNLGDEVGVSFAGARIVKARPPGGYQNRKELKNVLGAADFKRLAHHITIHAWVDKQVVNPVPLSIATLGVYPVKYNESIGLYRYGRSRDAEGNLISEPLVFAPDCADPSGTSHAIMALDEINAQWIERTSRAPVNINSASKEVLTAVITGLRGWFIAERRQFTPGAGEYSFMVIKTFDNRPGQDNQAGLGDDYGYLYATPAFVGRKGSANAAPGGVSARAVAQEIIACRDRQRSPNCPGLDYDSQWYGGRFRSWRQFNAFCDALVQWGLLKDSRQIYFDYASLNQGGAYIQYTPTLLSDGLTSSVCQKWVADQALADVLKANFNPNCSLNELNPDRNLFLSVDKTDLIANSTEFCFTPMGIFDVESEGLIVRPPAHDDFLRARRGEVVARQKVECIVKAYDVYRDTLQADFMEGDLGVRVRSAWQTNSNYGMEIGPEPDCGPAAAECRWSGYLQLSTLGGIYRDYQPGTVPTTPDGKREYGAVAHAHFQYDQNMHHHAGKQPRHRQFSQTLRNNADRTEGQAGPYNPTLGRRGRYRLARAWDKDNIPMELEFTAPSDLRIDGTYIERDSACMYDCSDEVFGTAGTVAYWIKASFRPEMSGKPRTFFSTDADGGWNPSVNPIKGQLINGQWFFPSHDAPAGSTSNHEDTFPTYWNGPWRPISFACGFVTLGAWGGGVGMLTPSLNHSTHKHSTPREDIFKHHEWIHIAYAWDMNSHATTLLVNGQDLPGRGDISVHPGDPVAAAMVSADAVFRLGEPSKTILWRNWAADVTLDEFYLWKSNSLEVAQDLYARGRYYRPRFGYEAQFTSRNLAGLGIGKVVRKMPDPSPLIPPMAPADPNRKQGTRTKAAAPPPAVDRSDEIRITTAFWTIYPESTDSRGRPMAYDAMTETEIPVEIFMSFVTNDDETDWRLEDEGGSPVEDLAVGEKDRLRYRLRIRMSEANGSTILKGTPVIDDVTIFYSKGTTFLMYSQEELTH
jgi:hypothetical protein